MAKKASGLGRGLGELLEDNAPQVNRQHRVTLSREIPVPTPPATEERNGSEPPSPRKEAPGTPAPRPLFDQPIRNRSIKANFRNYK